MLLLPQRHEYVLLRNWLYECDWLLRRHSDLRLRHGGRLRHDDPVRRHGDRLRQRQSNLQMLRLQ